MYKHRKNTHFFFGIILCVYYYFGRARKEIFTSDGNLWLTKITDYPIICPTPNKNVCIWMYVSSARARNKKREKLSKCVLYTRKIHQDAYYGREKGKEHKNTVRRQRRVRVLQFSFRRFRIPLFPTKWFALSTHFWL